MLMKNNTVSRPPLAPAPRSRPFVWSALLALSAVVGPMLPLQAQTSVLPALVSYQGRVSTANGLVGLTTGVGATGPVNRTVTFRIWGSSTGTLPADLLYSETQTVTISDGEFSVLIGQGTAVANETDKGKPTRTIDSSTVFGGATRYLGVTVDDGTAAADPEISPRQQLVSTAYAFRAKYAESVGTAGLSTLSTTDTGFVGIGNPTPPARLTVTAAGTGTGTPQFIITGADTNERLRFGVDETGNGTGYVQSFKEAVGNQPLLLNPGGGFVGINKTTAPTVALDVTGDITASGTLSAAQLNMSGRIMANALELWNGATANGLVRQGATGAFVSSSSAATNDIVLQSAQKLHFVSGATGSAATMTLNGTAVNTSGTFTAVGAVSGGSFSTAGNVSTGSVTTTGTINATGEIKSGSNFYTPGTILATGAITGGSFSTAGTVSATGTITGGSFKTAGIANFTTNGSLSAPTATTLGGIGSRLVLWPGTDPDPSHGTAGTVPYAMGLNAATMWRSVPSNGSHIWYGGTTERMRIDASGSVSINFAGDPSPIAKLVVSGGGTSRATVPGGYLNTAGAGANVNHVNRSISIYATNDIWTSTLVISSDARIKSIAARSNAVRDLELLQQIEVTDYTHIDTVAKGTGHSKKVIAQQVAKVFPQAVSLHTEVVPDIYRKATIKDGWVQLATDLKAGERVKVVTDQKEKVYEVLEVAAGKFRAEVGAEGETVFVYGREVKDFHAVDYEAIAMLNVSATQQVKRDQDAAVKTLTAENAELRAQVAAQRRQLAEFASRAQTQETRLAAIERLVRTGGAATPRPASVKSGEVEE